MIGEADANAWNHCNNGEDQHGRTRLTKHCQEHAHWTEEKKSRAVRSVRAHIFADHDKHNAKNLAQHEEASAGSKLAVAGCLSLPHCLVASTRPLTLWDDADVLEKLTPHQQRIEGETPHIPVRKRTEVIEQCQFTLLATLNDFTLCVHLIGHAKHHDFGIERIHER